MYKYCGGFEVKHAIYLSGKKLIKKKGRRRSETHGFGPKGDGLILLCRKSFFYYYYYYKIEKVVHGECVTKVEIVP